MTWREVIATATKRLTEAGVEDPQLNAEYLAAHVLGHKNRSDIRPYLNTELSQAKASCFEELVARREKREPLQYILGEWEFFGLPMIVGPGALIPRPETEVLVEEALKEAGGMSSTISILDIGTGSGAIALALAYKLPQSNVIGLDVSDEALAVAEMNRQNLNIKNVEFRSADIFADNWLPGFIHSVDLLVSNPPYVSIEDFHTLAPELRLYEPRQALTDESTGLIFYDRISALASQLLSSRGRVLVELGFGLENDVQTIMEKAGLTVLRIVNDLAGIPRVLVAKRSS